MSRVIKVGLILLLVFVSVIIVWIGLKAIINYNSESITIGKYNSDLRISQVQMMNYEDVNVKIRKTSYQDEIKGVNFVVYNKEGSEMTRYHISMEELEQNYFQVVLSVENTSNVRKITIAPVILSKSGEQIVGNLQDEYKVTGTATVFNPPKEDTGYAENRVKYCTFASDCKDDDPCTSGACSGGLCSYPVIHGCEFCVSDLECNDNNSCTNNLCVEERCSYPVIDGCQSCRYIFQCEDNNPCTEDECIENGCIYTPIANCTSCILDSGCEDNDSCTQNLCSFGKCFYRSITNCTSCTLDSECEDNNPCTQNLCIDRGCSYPKIFNCTSCNSVTKCNDNNACTTDECSGRLCTYSLIANCTPCTSNLQCNDNNPCTTDSCSAGMCKYTLKSNCNVCTSALQCEDNNNCTDNTCSKGVCLYPRITSCINNDGCCPPECTSSSDNDCVQCTSALQCEDNNPCTINKCLNNTCSYSEIPGCLRCTLPSQCNDNNSCTENLCSNGVCLYAPITSCTSNDNCCPAGCTSANDSNCAAVCGNNMLEGAERCDGTNLGGATCAGVMGIGYTGTLKCSNCMFNTSLCIAPCVCPDEPNICTTDLCSNNVCQHTPISECCINSSQCNDNIACTANICSSVNRCSYPQITSCVNNDRCCPTGSGCNVLNDNNCEVVCGNGYREGSEGCDDGGKNSEDGCSSTCSVESGWTCDTSTPNVCEYNCVASCSGKECGSNSCNTGSCGTCTNAQDHGSTSCSPAGICQPVCSTGYANCDGNRVNGCETMLGTASNCASCGNSCGSGTCSGGKCSTPQGGYLLADHNAAMAFKDIPDSCLTAAKKLTMYYGHTSHGSRVWQGAMYLKNYVSSKYNYASGTPYCTALPSDTTALRVHEQSLAPEGYWASSSGKTRVTTLAKTGKYDFSMFSWCGQQSSNSIATVNSYLSVMSDFEDEFPDMRFILMTGHSESSTTLRPIITRNNNLIRDYAKAHNMVIFDFEDVEKYDPNGNYYSNYDDSCSWCTGWCNSHPSECRNLPECAHVSSSTYGGILCVQQAKAFWWMMARLAGWDGIAGHGC